jgi:hypothetical protein
MAGDECLIARPVIEFRATGAHIVPGQFEIVDICSARCDCSDFASVANYASRIWNQWRALAKNIESSRVAYHDAKTGFEDWVACIRENPVRLAVTQAKPCGLSVTVTIVNSTTDVFAGVVVKIKVANLADEQTGEVRPGMIYSTVFVDGVAIQKSTEFTLLDGEYTVPIADIPAGRNSNVFLRYTFNEGQCNSAGNVTVSLVDPPDSLSHVVPVVGAFDLSGE